jgi:hypothetical protein
LNCDHGLNKLNAEFSRHAKIIIVWANQSCRTGCDFDPQLVKECKMSYLSLGLTALGGTVAYFAFGFLVLWLVPGLINEARKYPAVFRPKEEMMTVMPIGFVSTFISILVVSVVFAMIHQGGSAAAEGARSGVLIGIFMVCAFVLHNYVNLNIGLKLALGQAVVYFVQWTIVGIVIGLIYKPLATP